MSLPATQAMRRNIVPLLGIAFVVAVLCTGLFYGVFASRFGVTNAASLPRHTVVLAARDLSRGSTLKPEDVRTGEVQSEVALKGTPASPEQIAGRTLIVPAAEGSPILESMLGSVSDGSDIPKGMRALTIRPSDSVSVLAVLQPGRQIDVQAWCDRAGQPQLRTILQNVPVIAVPRNESGNAPSGAITVLVPAGQADAVALADSAAHVRIALRSSDDKSPNGPARTALASLFASPGPILRTTSVAASSFPELTVSMIGVTDTGLRKLNAASGLSGHGLRVYGLGSGGGWEAALKETLASREAVEMSTSRVGAAWGNTVQFGGRNWKVRVHFEAAGSTLVRIEPEVITEDQGVMTVRRTHGDLEPAARPGAAAIVTGVCGSPQDRASVAEHAHGAGVQVEDLVILVRSHAPALTASLPRTNP